MLGPLELADLIGFKATLANAIVQQIHEKTGLAAEQILLTAIHTHSAPTLSLRSEPSEGGSAEDAKRTAAYTRSLQKKLVDLAARALSNMKPGRLSAGTGVATFVMNRREFTVVAKDYAFSPNRIEVLQDDLVKLTVRSEDVAYSVNIDEYRVQTRGGKGVINIKTTGSRENTHCISCCFFTVYYHSSSSTCQSKIDTRTTIQDIVALFSKQ